MRTICVHEVESKRNDNMNYPTEYPDFAREDQKDFLTVYTNSDAASS